MKKHLIPPFITGLVIGAGLTYFTLPLLASHTETTHPIGYADNADDVHVHSDFVVYLDGTHYDLTDDKYQTEGDHLLHKSIHLHDNVDEVIHRHDFDITLSDFFSSLGFTLTNDSITDDAGNQFASDTDNELLVFVNDERIAEPATYVNQEEDKILVYFGNKNDSEKITELLLGITDNACYYSGTCPERGIAPAESCGLTCEL